MHQPMGWLLAALLVVLAVAGCGGDGPASNGDGQAATADESAEDEPAGAEDDSGPAADESPAGDTPGEQPPTDAGGASGSADAAADVPGADVQAAVEVRGGQVVGGAERIAADVGEKVALTVTSDVADTVHVHGYDREQPVAPGQPATVTFTADIPGVFEVELHDSGLKVGELRVGG